tara:strand:- start:640 stop:1203 length:564 start_codon:yes stop_codon:yes gene_type:complete
LRDAGCYAESGPLQWHWDKIGTVRGDNWETFCKLIEALPNNQLWRHNQAGDLPGEEDAIDAKLLRRLIKANRHKSGFTYTHKPPTPKNAKLIKESNDNGFTINLSANHLLHANVLREMNIGPIVSIIHDKDQQNAKSFDSPYGDKVVMCPNSYRNVTCSNCALCALPSREFIIGFPAKGKAKLIAKG